jgi:aminopeptidase N
MLSNYVGEDRFLKGVSIYLKSKLYGNSVTTDLWDGISKATGVDVPKVMDNWVTKVEEHESPIFQPNSLNPDRLVSPSSL